MTRSRATAKAAGTRFERLIADCLAAHVDDRIDRRAKTGSNDKGDIGGVRAIGGGRVVIEAKDYGGQLKPGPWIGEAEIERGNDDASLNVEAQRVQGDARWGKYAGAIARWEHALGRPAPEAAMTSTKGTQRLSPRFSEWLMGLPEGWVTDVPGITRNDALQALGNGVVPQQAAEALRVILGWRAEVAA